MNLSEMTVKSLCKIAKEMGLTGYSKLRKNDLISLIEKNQPKSPKMNRHERRRMAKMKRIMDMKKRMGFYS